MRTASLQRGSRGHLPRATSSATGTHDHSPGGQKSGPTTRRGAAVGRSIAEQTVDELGGRESVLVRQRADHVQLDRLLGELDAVTGPAQEDVLNRIDRLVFSHAFAEE